VVGRSLLMDPYNLIPGLVKRGIIKAFDAGLPVFLGEFGYRLELNNERHRSPSFDSTARREEGSNGSGHEVFDVHATNATPNTRRGRPAPV
jgi:hypothetical protein